MYFRNSEFRLETKFGAWILVHGFYLKNPIFGPSFDGSIYGTDFGLYGFRFAPSKNWKCGPVLKP